MNKGVWILWPAALAASLLAVPFLAACSSSEGNKVAGGTEAESTLAFHVQRSDGSVAPYARVRVRKCVYARIVDNYVDNLWNFCGNYKLFHNLRET